MYYTSYIAFYKNCVWLFVQQAHAVQATDHQGFFARCSVAELTHAAGIEEKRVKLQTATDRTMVEMTQQ